MTTAWQPKLTGLAGSGTTRLAVAAGRLAWPDPEPRTTAEQKRGSKPPPAHAPRPGLPPQQVLHHLRKGNETVVAQRTADKPAPRPKPRPAGAGRYICAILVCADVDLDLARVLGLHRRDVLVISSPGPFVPPEAGALLEHGVSEERLPLIAILTHPRCLTTAIKPPKTPRQTALASRVAAGRRRARQSGNRLPRALAQAQREMLAASSVLLQHSLAADHLRILPTEVDAKTWQVTWHTT